MGLGFFAVIFIHSFFSPHHLLPGKYSGPSGLNLPLPHIAQRTSPCSRGFTRYHLQVQPLQALGQGQTGPKGQRRLRAEQRAGVEAADPVSAVQAARFVPLLLENVIRHTTPFLQSLTEGPHCSPAAMLTACSVCVCVGACTCMCVCVFMRTFWAQSLGPISGTGGWRVTVL